MTVAKLSLYGGQSKLASLRHLNIDALDFNGVLCRILFTNEMALNLIYTKKL